MTTETFSTVSNIFVTFVQSNIKKKQNNKANLPVRPQNLIAGDKLYATYISSKSLFDLHGNNINHIKPNVGSKF